MEVSDIFWSFMQERKGIMVATSAMALVAPAIDFVLLPRLYVQLINAVASGTQPMIDRYIGHMLSAMALLQGVHVARSLLVTHLLPAFDAHLKLIVLRHIFSRDVSCDVLTSGDIVYLLSTMSELSRTWVEWWNNQILPHTALLLCAFTVFLRIDVGLATTFMVFLVTMSLAVVGTHRSAMSVSDHTQSMSVLHKHLEDLIHNVHAIQSADAIDMEMDQLQATLIPNAYREYHRAFSKAQQLQTIMIPVGVVFMLVFLKQIIQLRRSGRIPHSEFVSVFFIIATLINTFTWLMDNLGKIIVQTQNLSQMSAAITRFTRVDATWSSEHPAHRPPAESAIGMEDVTFTYQGTRVFDHRSLAFARGTRTAVVGPIGCGKTTLLRLLLGFCVPDRGHLYIEGQWYGELAVANIRRRIGLVPQDTVLFETSLIRNVRYGNESTHSEEAVRRYILEKAGHILGDRIDAPSVGPGGQELSGGQRQLVWCLRVLLRAPAILLMDEPTSFMDAACKRALVSLLDDARARQATIVMVTHDPFLSTHVDRTLYITLIS